MEIRISTHVEYIQGPLSTFNDFRMGPFFLAALAQRSKILTKPMQKTDHTSGIKYKESIKKQEVPNIT